MDVLLWMAPLVAPLAVLLLLWSSGHALIFYFKKIFYVAWMMVLALVAIPLCVLKSGGRDVENMKIVRGLVRHVKYFLGLRFEVSGWEHLQTPGPYVIISNHQSSLDVLGLMEILPDRCTMIAKKELIYAGSVGIVCWLGGIIFINRKKTSDAKSVLGDAAKTMLDEQIRLWVFPEGTRNQRGDLLPFKKGAFHLAVQAQVGTCSKCHVPKATRPTLRWILMLKGFSINCARNRKARGLNLFSNSDDYDSNGSCSYLFSIVEKMASLCHGVTDSCAP